ncbi:MAG: hypothetical protein EX263_07105 [Flavobacteriaceae bacterium]|nr:MAG: hypothetical protein EX263_07105 [Flavobacteriaceae bacterium]
MNPILKASITTVSKSKAIIDGLSNAQLSNTTIPPYYSCIGTHIRHILDFYHCIFSGLENSIIDLTARDRNQSIEQDCNCAKDSIQNVITKLEELSEVEMDKHLLVLDDLGHGKIEINYTLGALLAQANSHTIHHYAIISYILNQLDLIVEDATFGYNPATPLPNINLN